MKRRKMTALLVILCVFLAIGGGLFIRIHNGTKIKPSVSHEVSNEICLYRQDDEAWAADYLGDSSYTMKSSGCLVTCIAAAISDSEDDMTPKELNLLFSENGIYDKDGNIQWSCLAELEGYTVEVYNSAAETEIAQCLTEGHYPIVRVRMHGIGNYHYVLIVGTQEEEYICMDPLEDHLTKLSDYFDRVYAVRCVWQEE